MRAGAQISSGGGISRAVERAAAMGAECLQLFLCAPQQWREPAHSDEEVQRFKSAVDVSGIRPNFAHAIYLINLASPDPLIRQRSIDSLSAHLSWAERVGLEGVVVHVGSSRGQPLPEAQYAVTEAIESILHVGGSVRLLLENSAGAGNTLGARFEQIGGLMERLGRPERLGLCLDTAHAFASGYDLRTGNGRDMVAEEIDRFVGLDRLRLVHVNDSKSALGSALDRHENIGEGQIGEEALGSLLNDPAFNRAPWVLEVPGPLKQGPEATSIQALLKLGGRSTLPAR